MLPIRSLIVYNGGTGGDFLKMICCRQLYPEFEFVLTPNGMIDFSEHYLKAASETLFIKKQQHGEFDSNKLYLVDNSHYYLDCYNTIAQQLFFIDYPDHAVEFIIDVYKAKRWKGNHKTFFDAHHNSLPDNLKKYVTEDNIIPAVSKLWIKQLKLWRSNPALTAIPMSEFFDQPKLETICETLMRQPIRDQNLFDHDYNNWLEKNQKLLEFF